MAELISRAAAIARIDKCVALSGIGLEPVMAVRDVKALISVLPAVDAVPVVHGRWKEYHAKARGYGEVYYQHDCTPILYESPYKYCPNCGAKMDSERRDEDG